MFYPPSLSPNVVSKAFRAANGELGLFPADIAGFLDACEADGVGVLRWALWLVDHDWDYELNLPRPFPGRWSGIIPLRDDPRPNIIDVECDLERARAELARLDLDGLVDSRWRPQIRLNFTLTRG